MRPTRALSVLLTAAALTLPVAAAPVALAASAPTVVPAAAEADSAPTGLTVGQRDSPADVDDRDAPLLGWRVASSLQSAYRIQVAPLGADLADAAVWDSGKVETAASTNVAYAGPQLDAATGYRWRVRTWDAAGEPSAWSEPATFGTAPDAPWGDAVPIWLADQAGATAWTDYTVETTFRITSQNASIVFRAKDANNGYMWQIRGDGVNQLAPHKRVNGAFTVLKTVPLPLALARDTDYRLKLEVNGETITTSIDGTVVDTTTDPTFASGAIGFRTGGSERSAWDDMSVTAADGTVLYQSAFDRPSSEFACATVSDGCLVVGTNANCVYGQGGTDWAFLRGETQLADKEIARATLFATASSTAPTRQYVYKAWVNGTFVGLGPTQPVRSETRYDGYDVTSLLKPGADNAIGALAYTTSDKRFLAQLVVEYADGSRQTYGTGGDWRTLNGSTVFPSAGSIGTGYFVAPKENLQAAAYPTGFERAGFDASAWKPAQPKAAFADLQATPTAKVEQQLRDPVEVIEKSPGNYFIDYGKTWIGGLSLDVDGTAGQVLDLRFGEELSAPQTVRYAMRTGNTYQDRWTLAGGRQHVETWGMRVFRYVEVLGAPTGLGKKDFTALAQIYPYDAKGAVFDSSDDNLNQVWELSRHTIEATNHNLYVDSWSRERGAYEADSYLQMMANFFVSDDPTLGNYSLEYLLSRRTWPTEWPMYTILAFHDSFQQTGDTAALAMNYAALVDKLPDEWLEQSTGLIRKNSGSNGASGCGNDCDIVDWPTSERDGYVFRPYNTVINAIGHQSYRDMAEIAKALGKDADAARFTATADRLREEANARLFDETKGAYRDGLNADGTPVDHFAFHASVFATAFGLAGDDRAEQTADYIESRGMACSVYCAAFVLESLYDGDRAEAAHAMLTGTGLRSWMNMIAKGAGATAEAWDVSLKSNMTWSHPWAASPAYNVPQGMFGIEPTTPGYSTFDVRPQPEAVDWAHVTLPTLKGSIGAAHHTVDGRTDIGVHIPGNTVARVSVPGAAEGDDTVYVDGRATPAAYERGYLRVDGVAAGCHVLSLEPGNAAGLDDRLTSICPEGYDVAQTITLEPLPARAYGDAPFALEATASSALPVSYEATGVCRVEDGTVTLTGAGTCTITASQPGDEDYAAAEPVTRTFTVGIGLLDDFERPDGPVGAGWTGLPGPAFYRVVDRGLDVRLGGPLVWKESFGTTQEASVRIRQVDTRAAQGLLLKVQTGSIPDAGAISVVYDGRSKGVRVSALRLARNGWTDYGLTQVTLADGDVLRARVGTDGVVTVWRNDEQLAAATLNAADRAFFDARGGRVGLWTVAAGAAVLDDVRGGTIG
ncbi:family 78 glycoside hydrolase catalytic domain [Mumia qirimensis]|uniref:family 78 glycoside hydrolase catalytic domain n=1 Tax=Mumia qirimensis TaxID=3234852 RepID=UPI00351D02B5